MTETQASKVELLRWRGDAAIADEADRIAMAGFGGKGRQQARRSLVTEVDRAIEGMAARVSAADPGCGLFGEEEGIEAPSGLFWYVDPIDATANYVRGIPIFATLLAVALDGEIQLGLVSAPAMRRWLAWRGGERGGRQPESRSVAR